jgi:mannose-6-phosphate isomerase-like protein (cupin superfamily)
MKRTILILASLAFMAAIAVGLSAQQPARGTPPAPPKPLTVVKFVGHDAVAGCSKAGSFANTPAYSVTCSHRVAPGVVEIHTKETDVIYVLDGSATFVTGGKALDVTATDKTQPRGKDIQGGEVHHLAKGDVIIVPAGTPHWFKEVPSSGVSYFVTKSVAP